MLFETNREKGRAGMSLAIAYFGSNGYTVSIPLNDTQWYDLIVEKDKNFYLHYIRSFFIYVPLAEKLCSALQRRLAWSITKAELHTCVV